MPVDQAGAAYVGFTASTGNAFENHDILDFSFTPLGTSVSSRMSVVQSELTFLPGNCLPDRNLCTPKSAVVEEKVSGKFSVIVPAHLEWGASIPNPQGRPISVSDSHGLVCFDVSGDGADTRLSVNIRKGKTSKLNQGFFDVLVKLQ